MAVETVRCSGCICRTAPYATAPSSGYMAVRTIGRGSVGRDVPAKAHPAPQQPREQVLAGAAVPGRPGGSDRLDGHEALLADQRFRAMREAPSVVGRGLRVAHRKGFESLTC